MSKAITSCKKALAYLLTAAMVLGMAVTSPITAVEVKAEAKTLSLSVAYTVDDENMGETVGIGQTIKATPTVTQSGTEGDTDINPVVVKYLISSASKSAEEMAAINWDDGFTGTVDDGYKEFTSVDVAENKYIGFAAAASDGTGIVGVATQEITYASDLTVTAAENDAFYTLKATQEQEGSSKNVLSDNGEDNVIIDGANVVLKITSKNSDAKVIKSVKVKCGDNEISNVTINKSNKNTEVDEWTVTIPASEVNKLTGNVTVEVTLDDMGESSVKMTFDTGNGGSMEHLVPTLKTNYVKKLLDDSADGYVEKNQPVSFTVTPEDGFAVSKILYGGPDVSESTGKEAPLENGIYTIPGAYTGSDVRVIAVTDTTHDISFEELGERYEIKVGNSEQALEKNADNESTNAALASKDYTFSVYDSSDHSIVNTRDIYVTCAETNGNPDSVNLTYEDAGNATYKIPSESITKDLTVTVAKVEDAEKHTIFPGVHSGEAPAVNANASIEIYNADLGDWETLGTGGYTRFKAVKNKAMKIRVTIGDDVTLSKVSISHSNGSSGTITTDYSNTDVDGKIKKVSAESTDSQLVLELGRTLTGAIPDGENLYIQAVTATKTQKANISIKYENPDSNLEEVSVEAGTTNTDPFVKKSDGNTEPSYISIEESAVETVNKGDGLVIKVLKPNSAPDLRTKNYIVTVTYEPEDNIDPTKVKTVKGASEDSEGSKIYTIPNISEDIDVKISYTLDTGSVTVKEGKLADGATRDYKYVAKTEENAVISDGKAETVGDYTYTTYRVEAGKKFILTASNVKAGKKIEVKPASVIASTDKMSDGSGTYTINSVAAKSENNIEIEETGVGYEIFDSSDEGYSVLAKVGTAAYKEVPKAGSEEGLPVDYHTGVTFKFYKGNSQLKDSEIDSLTNKDSFAGSLFIYKVCKITGVSDDAALSNSSNEFTLSAPYVEGDIYVGIKDKFAAVEQTVADGNVSVNDIHDYIVANADDTAADVDTNVKATSHDGKYVFEDIQVKKEYKVKVFKKKYNSEGNEVIGYEPVNDPTVRLSYNSTAAVDEPDAYSDFNANDVATKDENGVYTIPADKIIGKLWVRAEKIYTINLDVNSDVDTAANKTQYRIVKSGVDKGTTTGSGVAFKDILTTKKIEGSLLELGISNNGICYDLQIVPVLKTDPARTKDARITADDTDVKKDNTDTYPIRLNVKDTTSEEDVYKKGEYVFPETVSIGSKPKDATITLALTKVTDAASESALAVTLNTKDSDGNLVPVANPDTTTTNQIKYTVDATEKYYYIAVTEPNSDYKVTVADAATDYSIVKYGDVWEVSKSSGDYLATGTINITEAWGNTKAVKFKKVDGASIKVEYTGYVENIYGVKGKNETETTIASANDSSTETINAVPGTKVKFTYTPTTTTNKIKEVEYDNVVVPEISGEKNAFEVDADACADKTITAALEADPAKYYNFVFDIDDHTKKFTITGVTGFVGGSTTAISSGATDESSDMTVLANENTFTFTVTADDGYEVGEDGVDWAGAKVTSDTTSTPTVYTVTIPATEEELTAGTKKGSKAEITITTQAKKSSKDRYFKFSKSDENILSVTLDGAEYDSNLDQWCIKKETAEGTLKIKVKDGYRLKSAFSDVITGDSEKSVIDEKKTRTASDDGNWIYEYKVNASQLDAYDKGSAKDKAYTITLGSTEKQKVKLVAEGAISDWWIVNDSGEDVKQTGTFNDSVIDGGKTVKVKVPDYKELKVDDTVAVYDENRIYTFVTSVDTSNGGTDSETKFSFVASEGKADYKIEIVDKAPATGEDGKMNIGDDGVCVVEKGKTYTVKVYKINDDGSDASWATDSQTIIAYNDKGEEVTLNSFSTSGTTYASFEVTPTDTSVLTLKHQTIASGVKTVEDIKVKDKYEVLTLKVEGIPAKIESESGLKAGEINNIKLNALETRFKVKVTDTNGDVIEKPEAEVDNPYSLNKGIEVRFDKETSEIVVKLNKDKAEVGESGDFVVSLDSAVPATDPTYADKNLKFTIKVVKARTITDVKLSANTVTYRPGNKDEITVEAYAEDENGWFIPDESSITVDKAEENGIKATVTDGKITFEGGADKASAEFTVMVDADESFAKKVTVTVKDRTISDVWVGDRSLTGNIGWTLETSVGAECDLDPQFVPTADDIKVELIQNISGNADEIDKEIVNNRIIFTCKKEASGKFEISIDGVKADKTITVTFVEREDEPGTPADAPSAYDKPEDSNLDINDSGLVIEASKAYTYTGKPIQASVKVKANPSKLVNGVDYKVTYADNVEAGEGRILVSGIGQYSGLLKDGDITFTINKKKANGFTVVAGSMSADEAKEFNVSDVYAVNDRISVYDGTTKLWINDDYTIESIAKSTNGKKIDFVIKGTGNYDSTTQKKASIAIVDLKGKKDIAACDEINIEDQKFTGSAIKISDLSVTVDGDKVESDNYSVTYKNNKEVGVATVTIKGKKDYAGTKVATFSIVSPEVNPDKDVAITVNNGKAMTYTGKLLKPSVKVQVTVDGKVKTLSKNRDYVVYYSAELNAGEGGVVIRGLGSYREVLDYRYEPFQIKPADFKKVSIKKNSLKQSGVYFNNKKLVVDEDFIVAVSGPDAKGKYTVTISVVPEDGSRNFTGSATKTIKGTSAQIDWEQLGYVLE